MRRFTRSTVATAGLEFLVAGSLLVGTVLTWSHLARGRSDRIQEVERAASDVQEAADSIDALLRRGEPIAEALAERLFRSVITVSGNSATRRIFSARSKTPRVGGGPSDPTHDLSAGEIRKRVAAVSDRPA